MAKKPGNIENIKKESTDKTNKKENRFCPVI